MNEAVRTLKPTRVIVAHRPETIASADRVIKLDAGRVVTDAPAPTSIHATEHAALQPELGPIALAG